LDGIKLADIVKTIIKNMANEVVSRDSITQVINDVAKKLASEFKTFQVTVKVDHDGRVAVWVFAEFL